MCLHNFNMFTTTNSTRQQIPQKEKINYPQRKRAKERKKERGKNKPNG